MLSLCFNYFNLTKTIKMNVNLDLTPDIALLLLACEPTDIKSLKTITRYDGYIRDDVIKAGWSNSGL